MFYSVSKSAQIQRANDLFSKLAYFKFLCARACVCVCVYARVGGWVWVGGWKWAPRIVRWVISFTLRSLYPWYQLHSKLGLYTVWTQWQIYPFPWRETNTGRPHRHFTDCAILAHFTECPMSLLTAENVTYKNQTVPTEDIFTVRN
jgi:hypothetical protein